MQITAGMKKEAMELFKTYRIFIFFVGFVLFAVVDPFMIKVLPKLMEQSGVNMQQLGSAFAETQQTALTSYVGDAFQLGVLAMLLSMMKIAGGDQKNRSCVIPICAGFKRETYIYSKFLVIAPIAFVAACIGYGIAYGVSGVLFTQRAELVDVLFSCLAFCVFIAFIACFMLFLGSITGKAGISAVCIFFFNTIVMMILPSLKLNHYNPFALQSFATSFGDVDKIDYFASIGITLAVCVLFAIIAAKIFKKKRLV